MLTQPTAPPAAKSWIEYFVERARVGPHDDCTCCRHWRVFQAPSAIDVERRARQMKLDGVRPPLHLLAAAPVRP